MKNHSSFETFDTIWVRKICLFLVNLVTMRGVLLAAVLLAEGVHCVQIGTSHEPIRKMII